jgi:hypothetical protein
MTELWDDRAYRVEHNTGLVDIRTHPDMPLNMHMWLPPGVDVETAIRLLKSEYRPVKQDKEPTTNADTTAPETCDAESPSVVTDSDGPIRTKRLSEYEAPKQPFRK